jgi:hypothetical protein
MTNKLCLTSLPLAGLDDGNPAGPTILTLTGITATD